jgi:peptidoglycan/LPS O-acetylase OafA/YrhL
MKKSRSMSLDVLRIIAASWVLLYHWTGGSGFYANLDWQYPTSEIPTWLFAIAKVGYLGVDVFFVLSGALIAKTAMGKSWVLFSRSRFLRLFPVFFMVSILAMIIVWIPSSSKVTVDNILSLAGVFFWVGGDSPVGPSWTLAFEVGFYALVALAVFIFVKIDASGLIRATDLFLVFVILTWKLNWPLTDLLALSPFGALFVLGIYLSLSPTWKTIRQNAIRIALAFVLSVMVLMGRLEMTESSNLMRFAIAVLVLSMAVTFILWSNFHKPGTRISPIAKILTTLSLMTYPFYLLHQEVGMSAIVIFHWFGANLPTAVTLSIAILLALSYGSVTLYEPAARRSISRFLNWK